MQKLNLKQIILLLGFLLPAVWCDAIVTNVEDGLSHILIKEGTVQGMPKGTSIQASIDGHYLTVAFTENLGQVAIEITTASGAKGMKCLDSAIGKAGNLITLDVQNLAPGMYIYKVVGSQSLAEGRFMNE